jgi:2-dehydropantoate 2-reductase
MIISLLNGIDSEEIIAKQFGYGSVIYAFIYDIDATKIQNVISYSKKGIIVFGEKDGSVTDRIDRLKAILNEAEIRYEVSNDIIKNMWWKYMVNIGINQATAILRAPYRAIQKISYTQELIKAAMREAIEISKSLNINLSEEDIDKTFDMLMSFSPDGKTSMLQDVEAKRKTEVEMLSGKLCLLGKQFNISTPVNHMFFNLIKSMESMY